MDIARLTQLARRRKLDMPSAIARALEGPQLSPEGRERAAAFLKLYRSACGAFEDRRPDAFVLRLIERIGLRRQQVFATQADTAERLRNIAKLPELAAEYMRREPQATPRSFTRYLAAVAESGLREEEAEPPAATPAIRVMTMHAAKGLEFDHVFVLGLSAARMPGPWRRRADEIPDELLKEPLPDERAGPRGREPPAAARGDDPRAQGAGACLARVRAPARARRRSTRRRARRWRRTRRSSRRSCSARPRGCTRPSG